MESRIKKSIVAVATAIGLNLVLALIKLFVGLNTNSMCILLDSVNNFLDTLTSIVAVIAFIQAARASSEKYPFGLARSEYLAGFIVAVVAVITGGTFLVDSINRILMPEPVWFGLQSTILISCTALTKLGMAIVFLLMNKKIRSKALGAIAMDCFLDVGITVATLMSFILSSKVNFAVDAIFGIVISVAIIVVSVKMVKDNLINVVSGSDFTEVKEIATEYCKKYPLVCEIKNVVVHDYGYDRHIGTIELVVNKGTDISDFIRFAEEGKNHLRQKTGVEFSFVPINK